jgi:hypothetical protein
MGEGSKAGGVAVAAGGGLLAIIGVIARNADDVARVGGKVGGGAISHVDDIARSGHALTSSADDLARGSRAFTNSTDDLARAGGHMPLTPPHLAGGDDLISGGRAIGKTEARAAADLGDIGFQTSKSSAVISTGTDSLAAISPGPTISKLAKGERVSPGAISQAISGIHRDTVNVLQDVRPLLNQGAASRAKLFLSSNKLPQRSWLGQGIPGLTRDKAVNTAIDLAAKHGDEWPKELLKELAGYAPDLALELAGGSDDDEDLSTQARVQFRKEMGTLLQSAEDYRQQRLPAARAEARKLSTGAVNHVTDGGRAEAELFDVAVEGLLYRLLLARAAEDVATHQKALR